MNAAVTTELKLIGHWIAGEATTGESGRSGAVYNPATGEQAGEVSFASVEEIDHAVAAAKEASRAGAGGRSRSAPSSSSASTSCSTSTATTSHGCSRPSTARCSPTRHGEVQRGIEVIEYVCGIPSC